MHHCIHYFVVVQHLVAKIPIVIVYGTSIDDKKPSKSLNLLGLLNIANLGKDASSAIYLADKSFSTSSLIAVSETAPAIKLVFPLRLFTIMTPGVPLIPAPTPS